jgi:UDP-3-O-[3-hydroxymyristoyl] glucosamine N-acyltransferase
LVGDGAQIIASARTLQEAEASDITFVENASYLPQLQQSQAAAVVVPLHLPIDGRTLIQVADPLMAFVAIVQHLQGKTADEPTGIDARAIVHPRAAIGAAPSIGPFASVGENTVIGRRCRLHQNVIIGKNCRLGDDVVLYPNVVLYDDTVLGDRVIIHANAVIGADGFGYRLQKGRHVKVPQLSHVVIGSDVEIGACATVDRGAFSPTIIGEGTKIDNHVQVAHNCQIGKHNLLAAQVGVAGSCTTGDYVVMAGQVGIADHLTIGAGTMLGAQSGLTHDVGPKEQLWGTPARPVSKQRRVVATMEKLPDMRRDLARIKKLLGLTDEEKQERAA